MTGDGRAKPQAPGRSVYSGRPWTCRPGECSFQAVPFRSETRAGLRRRNGAALTSNLNLGLLQSDTDLHIPEGPAGFPGQNSSEVLLPEHNCSIFVRFNCSDSLIQASMSCRLRLSLVTDVEYTFTAIFCSA